MIRHAIPYAASSPNCRCPVQRCGALIPDSACPDHGHPREPAMEWHIADNDRCQQLQAAKETT